MSDKERTMASIKTSILRTGRQNVLFTLDACQFLARSLENTFRYFADAVNLESITPPWLHFEILTPLPIEMQAGTFIEYRLRLHGIAIRWQTEITLWEPPRRFVDEQRRGPYRKWIHEHTFAERGCGCEMRDLVRYAVPGGWLADRLFVRREVKRIFEYRAEKLREFFAGSAGVPPADLTIEDAGTEKG